ncbi:hypothetical protein CDD82_526 [Ophiocordyceps australis]|uniref:Transcription factor domain-containing protein n=1 Tax=Ophiocordyceps australis TaxID=1399860 RepID=A0A2C5YIA3_9HYPO|nr:hypothetical protein CDD82_526 [Ophiocordyceps australis]
MWPPHPLPDFCGKTFTSLCKLSQVMQEVASVYFNQRLACQQGQSNESNFALSFAESKFQKLLAMTDSLSPGNTDHDVVLHILVHTAIIDIFQPFINKESETHNLPSFASPYSSARAAFGASIKQLQRLMVICRWQNPRVLAMVSTNTALVHVSNAMLRDGALQAATLSSNEHGGLLGQGYEAEWRSYFLLCLSNCQVSAMCYPAFKPVCRGLVAMAMQDGIMGYSEATSWMAAIDEHASRVRFGSQPTDDSGDRIHTTKSEEWTTFHQVTWGNDYVVD